MHQTASVSHQRNVCTLITCYETIYIRHMNNKICRMQMGRGEAAMCIKYVNIKMNCHSMQRPNADNRRWDRVEISATSFMHTSTSIGIKLTESNNDYTSMAFVQLAQYSRGLPALPRPHRHRHRASVWYSEYITSY